MKLKVVEAIKQYRSPDMKSSGWGFMRQSSSNFSKLIQNALPQSSPFTWRNSGLAGSGKDRDEDLDLSSEDADNIYQACLNQPASKDPLVRKQQSLFEWAYLLENPDASHQLTEEASDSPIAMTRQIPEPKQTNTDWDAEEHMKWVLYLEEEWPLSWEFAHQKSKKDFVQRILKDRALIVKKDSQEIDGDKNAVYSNAQMEYMNNHAQMIREMEGLIRQANIPLPPWPAIIKMSNMLSRADQIMDKILLPRGIAPLDRKEILAAAKQDLMMAMQGYPAKTPEQLEIFFMIALFVRMQSPVGTLVADQIIQERFQAYLQSKEYALRELFPFPETALIRFLESGGQTVQSILTSLSDQAIDTSRVLDHSQEDFPKDINRAGSITIGDQINLNERKFERLKEYLYSDQNKALPEPVRRAALSQLSQNGILWEGGCNFLLNLTNKKAVEFLSQTGEMPALMVSPSNEGLLSDLNIQVSEDGKKLYVDCSYTIQHVTVKASLSDMPEIMSLPNPVPLTYRLELFENENKQACVKVHVHDWEKVEQFLESCAQALRDYESEHPEVIQPIPIKPTTDQSTGLRAGN